MSKKKIQIEYIKKISLISKFNKSYYDDNNPKVTDQKYDELKKEMNSENINVLELSEVVQFLETKYKRLDESEEVSEEEDDDSGWCDNCDGEGKIGPFLDEDCDKCNGSGMSDPVYH